MRTLYLSIIFTVLGSLFIIGWGLDKLAETAEQAQLSHQKNYTTDVYHQLINGLSEELNQLPVEQLPEKLQDFHKLYQFDVSIIARENIALPASLHQKLDQESSLYLATNDAQYLLKTLIKHPQLLLQLDIPDEPEIDSSFNFVLTMILYISICCILIIWLFPLTRRLYLLNHTAAKIGAGQLDARIKPSSISYIKMFENSFNNMANQIEKLVADNKILARGLSHDIRTPIACLRFGLEAAIDTPTVDKKNEYLNRMEHELTRMEDMTSAFLDYASMERQALHLKQSKVSVIELLSSVKNDCLPLAKKQNVTVHLNDNNSKTIHHTLDYHWCYRALTNLLTNAISYANTTVEMTIKKQAKQLIITIEDDGKGIEEDKLDIIFTPFVKLDADIPREQGHFGLGLAICAKVMHWHKGNIQASKSKNLSGACFTLRFPIQ
ncbi:ATP-binding protein [Litorilituus lipolyticus]|uniref:histidine kinase n=1 Tax=Litorilituus lipolyticus TaxID=2491017 RepID=A0A502KRL0_9GAMM|nr:ATP-binding protein [Litorilituus lipolyticus]TPH12253.1 two-component sensor histidine kinase [Litorilituus lipolyticus]